MILPNREEAEQLYQTTSNSYLPEYNKAMNLGIMPQGTSFQNFLESRPNVFNNLEALNPNATFSALPYTGSSGGYSNPIGVNLGSLPSMAPTGTINNVLAGGPAGTGSGAGGFLGNLSNLGDAVGGFLGGTGGQLIGAGMRIDELNKITDIAQRSAAEQARIGREAQEASAFRPFTVSTGFGGIQATPTGGYATSLSPAMAAQQQALQSITSGLLGGMGGMGGGVAPNRFSYGPVKPPMQQEQPTVQFGAAPLPPIDVMRQPGEGQGYFKGPVSGGPVPLPPMTAFQTSMSPEEAMAARISGTRSTQAPMDFSRRGDVQISPIEMQGPDPRLMGNMSFMEFAALPVEERLRIRQEGLGSIALDPQPPQAPMAPSPAQRFQLRPQTGFGTGPASFEDLLTGEVVSQEQMQAIQAQGPDPRLADSTAFRNLVNERIQRQGQDLLTAQQRALGEQPTQAPMAPSTGGFGAGIPDVSGIQQQALGSVGGFLTGAMAPMGAREADVYERIRATQRPEEQRQQLALEERLAAQGRTGLRTAQFGGSPEQLALAQAQEEAKARASLGALGQAQAEQLQQAGLAESMFGLGGKAAGLPQALQLGQLQNIGLAQAAQYLPETQLLAALNPAVNLANIAGVGQREGAGLMSKAGISGLEDILQAETVRSQNLRDLYSTLLGAQASQQQAAGQQATNTGLFGSISDIAGAIGGFFN